MEEKKLDHSHRGESSLGTQGHWRSLELSDSPCTRFICDSNPAVRGRLALLMMTNGLYGHWYFCWSPHGRELIKMVAIQLNEEGINIALSFHFTRLAERFHRSCRSFRWVPRARDQKVALVSQGGGGSFVSSPTFSRVARVSDVLLSAIAGKLRVSPVVDFVCRWKLLWCELHSGLCMMPSL